MKRETVDTGTVWEGLAGYSRAIRIGDRILVSGTTATDADGHVVGKDPAAQTSFIIDKIEAAIVQLGGSLKDVVRTRIYLRHAGDWEPVARVHGERFGEIRPANTLVEARIIGDGYWVEIEAEAVVGAGDAL
ncbi:MAG: RidA family protein [Anaerolineales bacterium]|nr:RidA family protein [Anaerolineales bacterium]